MSKIKYPITHQDGIKMFINNKYYKWYKSIITRAQLDERLEGDIHHIIPRSMGGTNAKTNLVRLSWREHFVCHLLLVKCVEGSKHIRSMSWAVHRMSFSKRGYVSSWEFAAARRIHSSNLKNDHHSKRDPQWSTKLSNQTKASYDKKPELRQLRSDQMKQMWQDDNKRQRLLEQNRQNSAKGVLIKKARRDAGEVFARSTKSYVGSNNPAARSITLMNNETGAIHHSDCVKSLCQKLDLSYDCVISMRRGKMFNHRGYSIWKGDSANV